MEVILLEDMGKLGTVGDQVSVRDGYGRNYLIPKKLAIIASVGNTHRLEHEKRIAGFRLNKLKVDAQAVAEKLKSTSITIPRKVGEQDKLFGSVTTHDIEKALSDEGIKVDRRKIHLAEPIKALGVYQVPIKLPGDVGAEIKVWVVAE
ncbi:MAG: 50S ribosomal protein L9 [Deltaproteobacteria bacterium]|nr:50S ribosomal protein L9 [Deltaproteobacteria bacterium]